MLDTSAKNILMNKIGVSRETMDDLQVLVELLRKWNKAINLVGSSTIDNIWARHILDSAQMWRLRPKKLKTWVDLGSGGGFPALVLAILAKKDAPNVIFHMIESDARKCAFLKNVSRETSIKTKIHNCRIEAAEPIVCDVVSARALAPVSELLGYSENFLAESGYCLFLKGKSCATEANKARISWCFKSEMIESLSDNTGTILKAWNVERA